MKQVSGGVCAAKGFVAAGVHCGVKASSSPDKNDLALILSDEGVYRRCHLYPQPGEGGPPCTSPWTTWRTG